MKQTRIENSHQRRGMKNILALCGVCIAINGIAFAQKTDRERDGLKGPVKTVTVRQGTTLIENGKRSESPLSLTHVISYDQSGNRSEVALYEQTGTLNRRIVYEYDSSARRRSALMTYNSNNVVVRKVVDRHGENGIKIGSTIQTFNDDGTLFRRTEITFNTFGELVEVAQYRADGSLIKDNSLNDSERENVTSARQPRVEDDDRLVSFGQMRGCSGEIKRTEGSELQFDDRCFDPDPYGNWTRGIIASTNRTYASGQKSKQTTWAYREFTYY